MDRDRDGAYPRGQPPRERWDAHAGTAPRSGESRPGTRPYAPASGPVGRTRPGSEARVWGEPPAPGGVAAWGGAPGDSHGGGSAWGAARNASAARWEAPTAVAGPAQSAGGRRAPAFLRPPAVWFTGVAAVGSVVLVALTVLALLPPPAARTKVAVLAQAKATATATSLPQPAATATADLPAFALPAFHDWRAAYLGADGQVHVTSLDGQTDLTGPALALNTTYTVNNVVSNNNPVTSHAITSLAISPNGQSLAYINQPPQSSDAGYAPPTGDLVLEPLGANATWKPIDIVGQVTNIGGWSPDSSTLVFSATLGNATNIYLVNPTAPSAHGQSADLPVIPGFAGNGALLTAHVLGWIDNTHLLLMIDLSTGFSFPPLGSASAAPALAPAVASAVASASGATADTRLSAGAARAGSRALSAPLSAPHSSNAPQTLATVDITTGAGFTIATIPAASVAALSPDGTKVAVQNSCLTSCVSTPLTTEVIDTATGAVHSLPMSDKAIAPSSVLVWNPVGSSFAATVAPNPQEPSGWKVAVVNTQADSATTVRTSAFVIGWSPDGQALLVGDGADFGAPDAKTWLVAPGSGGAPVALPHHMVAFMGWVRTG